MELLQTITRLNNTSDDFPVRLGDGKLYFDAENTRVVLKLELSPWGDCDLSSADIKADVCCYDANGCKVTVLTDIPYIHGGILLEIPSLMAKHAEVIVRSVTLGNGTVISDNTPFENQIIPEADNSDTCRYDFSELTSDFSYETDDAEKCNTAKNNSDKLKQSKFKKAKKTKEAYFDNRDGFQDSKDSDFTDNDISENRYDNCDYDDDEYYYDYEPDPNVKLTRQEKKELRRQRMEEEKKILEFLKKDPIERRKRFLHRCTAVVVSAAALCGGLYAYCYKNEGDAAYKKAINLYNSGKFEDAVSSLENAEEYIFIGDKKKELDWNLAMCYAREHRFHEAAKYFKNLNGYSESAENYRSITEAFSGIVAAGKSHSIALCHDGTVISAGNGDKGQTKVSAWNNISKIAAGGEHSVALNKEGAVMAVGDNTFKQCEVTDWKNITDIAAGNAHTVGVENTGRVVAAGDNSFGQCKINDWSGVVAIAAGYTHTVGLKIDGTVVAAGSNTNGECAVSDWSNVMQIAAGNGFTVGLTYNGKILFTGDNSRGAAESKKAKDPFFISAGAYNVIVTDENGHTTAYGSNDSNQCVTDLWKNIVATAGGEKHSIGISADGTAYATGGNDSGQSSVESWNDVGIPSGTVTIRKGQ